MRRIADGMTIGLRVTGVRVDFMASEDDGTFVINENASKKTERLERTVRNKNALDLFVSFGAHVDRLESLVTPGAARLGIACMCSVIDLNFLR